MKRSLALLLAVVGLALAAAPAEAHTTQVGYTDNGDGTVTFYAANYHAPGNSPAGGLIITSGPAGVGTYNFTGTVLPGSLPVLDGLFIAGSLTPQVWQTVTIAGLVNGAYAVTATAGSFVEQPLSSGFPGTLSVTVTNAVVPEPTSMALFGLTVLGMGFAARRRRRRKEAAA